MALPFHGAAPPAPASPSVASPLTPELRAELQATVAGNDLVLFMKGTPAAPQCGFSNRAARALDAVGRPYHHVDVFARPDAAAFIRALAEFGDFPTLPQVWVKGELVGGSDIALEMVQSGELQKMLA
ncbi:MAG: monothiol glutaredoxin [Thermoplasmata archaeon]|jgi:monothiol glutaredoxin|nr:monothiol glutaredoxin [Thermoplasmata archaeon]